MRDKIHFGLKIRQLIEAKGETVEECASRIGISKSNMFKIVKKIDVNTSLLREVSNVYGVGLDYFFKDYNLYQQQSQNTGFQAIGEKIMTYEAVGQKKGLSAKDTIQNEILIERLNACESEKKLLREMIDLLKNK